MEKCPVWTVSELTLRKGGKHQERGGEHSGCPVGVGRRRGLKARPREEKPLWEAARDCGSREREPVCRPGDGNPWARVTFQTTITSNVDNQALLGPEGHSEPGMRPEPKQARRVGRREPRLTL